VIAVETPTYHGLLELIDSLGMLAIEVETCPEEGLVIAELERTLQTHDVKACMISTTLSNPLGVTMPEKDRRRLVGLLERYDTILIEDDVYGDLRFDGVRPVPAQFLGGRARIITCGSFSKTAAPGYRIGWVVTDHFIDRIERLKRSFSCSSGLLQQLTLADFLATGDYGRHLKALRPVLKQNAERMAALVAEHFPEETRTSKPVGGAVLWLELFRGADTEALFDEAIDAGISITPGHIFSPCSCYTNFLRLSYGHPWTERTEDAMRWLGRRVSELAVQAA
jgi:DNA-binding transcriptional MocR family regulator